MYANIIDSTLRIFRDKIIPRPIFNFFQPIYHYKLALLAALIYRFPSKKIKIIGVTGTKGKSSTVEIINAILEEAGYKTALSNTIRYKIGDESHDNLFKMSMPGRFFVQRFIRKAVKNKCDFLVLEMTSQAVLQYRHKFIDLDAFVLTNISPEHVEAHGSFENYVESKLKIAASIEKSSKRPRTIIVNKDDKENGRFSAFKVENKTSYSLDDARPFTISESGIDFTMMNNPNGKTVHSPLSGEFNLYNILAASSAARAFGVSDEIIARTLEKFSGIKGRVEHIEAGQDFKFIVDYAHTIDSLRKLYQVFESSKGTNRKICILGGTGGGRDTWKRKEMGHLADQYCDEIILTNEDPYDEDPRKIVDEVAAGITEQTPTIIMDRREAIRESIKRAKKGDVILITGKGTDPYIMGPNGTKTPWSDARIARECLSEELENRLKN